MKRILSLCSILIFSLAFSSPTYAQFFEKLGDKIENSVEERVDRNMNEAVDKSLDKAEKGTKETVNDAVTADEKNEKNQNDPDKQVTQEAGWPVPVEEENTAKTQTLPDNYQLGVTGSGPDLYLEYQISWESDKSEAREIDMHMKMYASPSNGRGRSETVISAPMVGEMSMVTLTNMKDPLHIIMLDVRKKQYSIIDLSKINETTEESNFTVTKLGEENLHGLHCTHVKATNQDGQSFEIWTTTEVPGYEKMLELYSKTKNIGSGNLWKKLQEKNCAGMMVKLKMNSEGTTSILELTKIENTDVPKSMFLVPAGYERNESGWAKAFMKK